MRASSCCTVLAYVILYILAYVLADIGLHMSHRLTQSLRLSFAVTSLNALIQISKTEAADPDISPGKMASTKRIQHGCSHHKKCQKKETKIRCCFNKDNEVWSNK